MVDRGRAGRVAGRGRFVFIALLLAALASPCARGGEVAAGSLLITGQILEVDAPHPTAIDIPGVVQTRFGGKTGSDAPPTNFIAMGDLTGPGLDAPITLRTTPGGLFTLPPLHDAGNYTLTNIRLADANGNYVQTAVPSSVTVQVTGVLSTDVKVTQLSPDDLRARGINIDTRNYDVFDYNFTFGIQNGNTVVIPYPIIVDKRTHEVITAPSGNNDFALPKPPQNQQPPRFQPPAVVPVILADNDFGDGTPPQPPGALPDESVRRRHPSIPAAIVIPTGFGVLHQFFAVILNVGNSAPAGSQITLDSVTATITTPAGLKVVKVTPAVMIGQPVPIRGADGATMLIAQAQGSADWSLEALKPGTHTVDLDIRAIYKAPNQADVPLRGHASSSIVVSDPRFQINFVHPDNVRAGEPYTAYAFVTNVSPQQQSVAINLSGIPQCGMGYSSHVCRTSGPDTITKTFDAGQTIPIAYRLTPDITGHVFAAAGDAPDGIGASVSLQMGVSASGVPLSPANLVLPYYAQYVSPVFVEAHMPLLGLGYSLAVAPLTPQLASLPRLIRNDVFTRAQDIARAGERIFVARQALATDVADEDREPLFHLALDLLGNVERIDRLAVMPDMREWDQLRRIENDGRKAGAAMARELERVGLANGKSMQQFVDDFASATSHRSPYALALVHGAIVNGNARPYALTVTGATSRTSMRLPAEADGATRTLAFGELTQFSNPANAMETGELAIVGRWSESLELSVVAASPSFTIDLIYPDAADGSMLRTSIDVSNATTGTPVTLVVDRGNKTLIVNGAAAGPIVNAVPQTTLALVHSAQDLHLDPSGHIVTLLFNRPIKIADANALRDLFSLTTVIPSAAISVTRKNAAGGPVVIPGAALQDDARMINVSFDHALSTNAQYTIALDPIADLLNAGTTYTSSSIIPRIDNDAAGGIVVGKLLRGDGTAVAGSFVQVTTDSLQYDTSLPDGSFLFEFIARDIDRAINGNYNVKALVDGKLASLDGVIRFKGEVQRIVLQLLGRGSANGRVTYSGGTPAANAQITIQSVVFNEFHFVTADANGAYSIKDLPVGPLTFAVADAKGNVSYASTQIHTPGEVITQDLVIQKRDLAGFGSVRVTVRRSDKTDADGNFVAVAGAHVGVYAQGYGLADAYTDAGGSYVFTRVPAGFISILAAEFGIARESAGVDLDLKPDSTLEQTLVLHVPTASDQAQSAIVHGFVKRDDPASPADRTKDVACANAIITIGNFASVTASAMGEYTYPDIPVTLQGKNIVRVFDPATNRQATVRLPDVLNAGSTNELPILLQTSKPQGHATIRIRLSSASGDPVLDYRILSPGYPPLEFDPVGGFYTATVSVPQAIEVWAVPQGHAPHAIYGDQFAHAIVHAGFDAQIVTQDLRLPGQGSVRAQIQVRKRCPDGVPSCPEQWDVASGKVTAAYLKWNDEDQGLSLQERVPVETDTTTGYALLDKVPLGNAIVSTVDHPSGYASANAFVQYEGHQPAAILKLETQGNVTGRIVNFDLQSPVAGANVTFFGSGVTLGPVLTKSDGSFVLPAAPAGQAFRIVAESTINGTRRTGYVDGQTPAGGGPVGGLLIAMRSRANIAGVIVDGNGAPVPLAHYWGRELAWPYTNFGSPQQPLTADKNGRFFLDNVFTGAVRLGAESPLRQEERGDVDVQLAAENDDHLTVTIPIGTAGTSGIRVTVKDSANSYAVVANAEVTLTRDGQAFDFGTSAADGSVSFDLIPVNNGGSVAQYAVIATSKVLGRAGSSSGITLTRDVPQQVEVDLALTGRVSGTVVDGDIAPPPPAKGVPVYLLEGSFSSVASTGSVGDFLFNGVPEGAFFLNAVDPESGRAARSGNIDISKLFPNRDNIALTLEKTGTAKVSVFLPDDSGASSGILAPLAGVTISQKNYLRELQAAGQEVAFPKLLTGPPYTIEVRELGGDERVVHTSASFAPGGYESSTSIVLPTTGSVRVEVTADDPSLVSGAKITVAGGGKGTTVFCDATGIVTVSAIPLGDVGVQVTSQNLAASSSGHLDHHSVPLVLRVKLGSRVSIQGSVFAEDGSASAATRVVADVTSSAAPSLHLESRTDAAGHYRFDGIPVGGTVVTLTFFGADDTTIGAMLRNVVIPDGGIGLLPPFADVHLDATPPSVVRIDPANNANAVGPNAILSIAFSELLNNASVNAANFQLVATDDGSTPATVIEQKLVNNEVHVEIRPASLLRSNVIYRLTVTTGVQDVTGLAMKSAVTSSFTTVDYTEPRIVFVDPPLDRPIDQGVLFKLKFNKAIDIDALKSGVAGSVKLERLDGYQGAVVQTIPLAAPRTDSNDASTLILAPMGVAVEPSSFYRVTVSGVRDTVQPPNAMTAAQAFDYFSVDQVKPSVTIVSPVPAGSPLIIGTAYTPTVSIVDSGTMTPSKDIAYVDWFTTDGTTDTPVARVRTAPFGYLVTPQAGASSLTLKASATDFSNNVSNLAAFTWEVTTNKPPQNVVVTPSASSVYLKGHVDASVTFADEGLLATVSLAVIGKHAGDSDYPLTSIAPVNVQVQRADVSKPWPAANFGFDLPGDLKEGTSLRLIATVKDSDQQVSVAEGAVLVAVDANAPAIAMTSPIAETHYRYVSGGNNTFPLIVRVADAESGIAAVTATCDGDTITMTRGAFDAATSTWTYSGSAAIHAKNADTRVPVTATATDYHGNATPATNTVIFESVNDPTAPSAQWITPLDGAALRIGDVLHLKLRIHATDDQSIESIVFASSAFAAQPPELVRPLRTADDVYEQIVDVSGPGSQPARSYSGCRCELLAFGT